MKIYTKKGDSGQTSLLSGERVEKSHPRLHAYGHLDELNSLIGLSLSYLHQEKAFQQHPQLLQELSQIQKALFSIGSHLASTKPQNNLPPLPQEDIVRMEEQIDFCTQNMPPLKSFILPGGSLSASSLHVARSVCRRAERSLLSLSPLPHETILKFINRLSDYLFTLARFANHTTQTPEQLWTP
ncbi:MAG: cob(I)yrinic acid a,c-diamide adenosyltransferase [Bdellovibrio sp.]|nr:MAG: cob(I)yrinic acid a,c-diamide adenosyltransferase [Bdellovibrio sp.]